MTITITHSVLALQFFHPRGSEQSTIPIKLINCNTEE